ncbi:LicD family protein [Flavobacteriales bacterium]|nr:LicD family protein [Flavobacteriales bacterium]
MTSTIYTKNGDIVFEEKNFSNPKLIDLIKSTNNLLLVKKVLDKNKVKFGLMFGTLLGAVREGNFIEHDEDIDLFVLEEDKDALINTLHELLDIGFKVCRYDGELLSIIRDNEYIDFYFFRKYLLFYRKSSAGLTYKSAFLQETKSQAFLGTTFQVPKETESFLKVLYGVNWKIPIKNTGAMSYSKYIIMREKFKVRFPWMFKVISKIKSKL